ncbi:hypothetical protein [Neobacillus citreus]|uniref:Uncharacterized protein n=1 Tax=Neobacillus citreus TaxID=2833578 RepID=A0A942YFR3_9BACI|nr:hypothetical protein [Neobacillus citreus]MCH6265092.1 hypothetical protein [Neobacillus citreus]
MEKKPLRLTISFSQQYEDVFHYLNAQENTSKFVCGLLQREMKNATKQEGLEKQVYKIIQQYIESGQLSFTTDKTTAIPSKPNTQLMDEEIDILKRLFD